MKGLRTVEKGQSSAHNVSKMPCCVNRGGENLIVKRLNRFNSGLKTDSEETLFFTRTPPLHGRTAQPSAERVLKAFSKVTLTILKAREGRETGRWLTPLSAVQQDILYHLGLESSLYSQLEIHNT